MVHLLVSRLREWGARLPIPSKNSLIAGAVAAIVLAVRCCCMRWVTGGAASGLVRGNATRFCSGAGGEAGVTEAVLGSDCWCWCWAPPTRLS